MVSQSNYVLNNLGVKDSILSNIIFRDNNNVGFVNFNYTYETEKDFNQILQAKIELNYNNYFSNNFNQKDGLVLINNYNIVS
jgi:hypothetical protein